MKKIIIFSENNNFTYDTFFQNKEFDVLCIFAVFDNFDKIKKNFVKSDVYTLENFERCNIKGLNKQKINELDSKILSEYSETEILSYKLLEFNNPAGDKFSLREIREAYYSGLNFALNLLDHYTPDCVIFTNTPHSLQGIILSKVCENKKIKFIFKREITFPGLYTFQDSFDSLNSKLDSNKISDKERDEYPINIKEKIENYIKRIKNIDTKFINKVFSVKRDHFLIKNPIMRIKPELIGNLYFIIKQFSYNLPKIILKFLRDLFLVVFQNKGKKFLYSEDFYKKKGSLYRQSKTLKITRQLNYLSGDIRKLGLLRYYNSLADNFEYDKNFIYFPLHYQPEATTYPYGNSFIDQINAIKLLSACLPENFYIFVKEHPDTFNISHSSWSVGDFSRDKNFYLQIKELKNVKIVHMNTGLDLLIKNSKAVATLTGAVGLEFILNGKHAFLFGNSWYDDCEGVIKCDSYENCRSAVQKIIDNSIIDEDKVNNFFVQSSYNLFTYDKDNTTKNINLIKRKLLEKINSR